MLQILRGITFRGNSKHPCCYCLYDNYNKDRHLIKHWPLRKCFVIGQHNVENEPLIRSESIVLPILHIKLGLVKQFVKYLDKKSDAFDAIVEIFPT